MSSRGKAERSPGPTSPVRTSTLATLYDVLALRSAVFVVEQECAYQDLDGRDLLEGTRHLIGRQGTIAAYARILAPERRSTRRTPRIGRVIVRASGSRAAARPTR